MTQNIWEQRWKNGKQFARDVWTQASEDRLPLAAAAISFYLLLSMIPLLLLAVTIGSFFVSIEEVRRWIAELTVVLGPEISETLDDEVLTVVDNRGVLTGVAVLFGLWAGSQVFVILESAINQVWRAGHLRPIWTSRGLALLMLLIVGVFILLAIALINAVRLLGRLEIPLWGELVRDIPFLISALVSFVVPVLFTTGIFIAIYILLPTKHVTLRSVYPGALFAGLLWPIFVHLFGWYVANFADYSILYGSLGGLVLLLFWFYYSSLIMLVGAEMAAVRHRYLMEAGDIEEQRVEEEE